MKQNKKSDTPSIASEPARRGQGGGSALTAVMLGAAGAALAGSAWFNRQSAQKAEAETPPAGAFVVVDGVRLHYVDQGEGPVVVLLHGNGVTIQDFEVSGVLELMAAGHRVLAFDRPGFGYSDRPRQRIWTPAAQAALIAGAIRQLGIDQAVMVGHSWGAMVALALALDDPELVSGLVLISGYYYGTVRPDVIPASIQAIPGLGDLLSATVSPLAARLSGPAALEASFAPAPVSAKATALPVGLMFRPSQLRASAAEGALMIPAAIALSDRYDEIDLPVIIMAGEGDLITHASEHAERLAKQLEHAELRMVPDQGHLLHFAVPEDVVAATDAIVRLAADRYRSRVVVA